MIPEERLDEMYSYFMEETNEEETEDWREDLTDEEKAEVKKWDQQYKEGFQRLCREILKVSASRDSKS